MTVKDLIEQLQKLAPELPVYVHSSVQGEFSNADEEGVPYYPTLLQKCKGKYSFGKRAGKSYTYLADAANPTEKLENTVGEPFNALVFWGE